MTSSPEIYVSTDIESDGPIPGLHSMLSFGSAAFSETGELIDTFQANLETIPGTKGDPKTMAWWATQKEAWEAHRQNLEYPESAMPRYVRWLKGLPGSPVFVGYPAGFDFTFMYFYMIKFAGESPFSFSALDIKTAAFVLLGCDYRQATKRNMPKKWFAGAPKHTHKALDDAMGQGVLFCNMLKDIRAIRSRSNGA